MATVTLSNIEKSYGDVHIIKGVNLQVEDHEFCVFVGPFRLRQVHTAADDRRPRGGDFAATF